MVHFIALSVILKVFGTNVMVTVAKSFEAPIKCKKHFMYSMNRSLRAYILTILTLHFGHIRPVFHRLPELNRAWLLVVYFSR